MNGSVYIATNAYLPDLVKIGRSADPARRMIELSGAAGVPGSFQLAHAVKVADMIEVEARMHRRFAARRVRGSEFFKLSVAEAKVGLARVVFWTRFTPRVTRRPARSTRAPVAGLLLSLTACTAAIYATYAGAGLAGFSAALALFAVFLAFAARYNSIAAAVPRRKSSRRAPAAKRWTPKEMIALLIGVTIALGLFVRVGA